MAALTSSAPVTALAPWEREEGAEIVLLAAIHLGGAWEGEESPDGWLGHGMTARE
jgi:hypothetical protein